MLHKRKYLKALCYFSLALGSADLYGTTYMVTNSSDFIPGTTPIAGSLRLAITQANTSPSPSSINFLLPSLDPINLMDSLPPLGSLSTPITITMDTTNQTVTVNGSKKFSGFFVLPNTTFILNNTGSGSFKMENTASVGGAGGAGSAGGGGGLGAGGGLLIRGTATINGINLTSCSAIGGAGGDGNNSSIGPTTSGGGGGMSQAAGGIGQGCPFSSCAGGSGGGGGFGLTGSGGEATNDGGGGGGGLFNPGGESKHTAGGGGGSDSNPGNPAQSNMGGAGGQGSSGSFGIGGTTGLQGGVGGNGTGTSGGGGGGGGSGGNSTQGGNGGGNAINPNGFGTGIIESTIIDVGGGGGAGIAGGGGGGVSGNLFAGISVNGGGGGGGFGGLGGQGGNVNLLSPIVGDGGNGGFGGGGGAAGGGNGLGGHGGTGGFGGGGGGSGGGGFGGGAGGQNPGPGGGGAALGGAIFIDQMAILNLFLTDDITNSTITKGPNGVWSSNPANSNFAKPGQALGTDIFIRSTGTLNFTHPSGIVSLISSNPIATDATTGGGPGGLMMSGAGTLILPPVNSYSGTTSFNGGIIQITADTALGLPQNPLSFNGGTLQMNAPISSSRSITLAGPGTLFMNASGTSTFSGQITGTGPIQITGGSGAVLFSGINNTYTGGTNVSGNGTLQIPSAGSIGTGTVTLGDGTFGGTLQLLQGFAGPTILNPFTIDNPTGTIISNISSKQNVAFAGMVTNNGAFTLNLTNASKLTFSGQISGSGSLVVEGGNVILTNTCSYSGPTTIFFGTLTVLGTISSSSILVEQLGTLKGTGTVQDVNIFGTIAPGNSIGTIHGSTFTFNPLSTYALEINNSTSDLISASGNALIFESILRLFPRGFSYPSMEPYTIITTGGAVIAPLPFILVNPLTRYKFNVIYNPTNVQLAFNGPPTPFHVLIPSGKEGHVAKCFDELFTMKMPDLAEVLNIIEMQTTAQMADSFHQMQPSNFNNIALAEENVAERIRQIYTNHFFEQTVAGCPETQPWRLWAAPFVERVRQHGTKSEQGYLERFGGFSTALDYRLKNQWLLTGGFSYAKTDMRVPKNETRADFSTYAGTLGAAWSDSKWFADAQLSYLFSLIYAKRTMSFSINNFVMNDTVSRTARHRENANQVLSHFGFGYDYKMKPSSSNTVNIYPFVNIDYLYLPQHGYTEHGAGSLDLKVKSKSYDLLRPEGGIGFGYNGCYKHIQALFDLSVSYIHEFRFLGKKTVSSFEPISCKIKVKGLKPENNLISPEARLRLTVPGTGISLALGYHGEYGKHFIMNAGEAEFRAAF